VRRHRVWLADLVALADGVSEAALGRIADAAGFDETPPMPEPTEDALQPSPGPGQPAAPPRPAVAELAPVPFWRAESAWFSGPLLTDGSEVPPPQATALREPRRGSLAAAPPMQSAVPWATLWPRIRALLRVRARGRAPDIPKTVRLVAKGRVLSEVPRVRRYRWPERVELWLDRAWRNLPLFADQAQVAERVARVVGHQRVQAMVLEDGWQRGRLASPDGFAPPGDGSPGRVLVLGDLGARGPEAVRRAWHRTAAALRRRGAAPLTVVPPGPGADPAWRTVPWERPAGPSTSEERRERVEQLLTLLSPAGLVEPGLLRAIRLAWRARLGGLAVELDLLGHPDIADFDPTAVNIAPAARSRWRERYAALDDHDKAQLRRLLARWHEGLPGEVAIAETLAQVGLGWQPRAGDAGALAEALGFAAQLGSLLHPRAPVTAETQEWRAFARRVTQALPARVYADSPVRQVLTTLRDHAAHDAPPPQAGEQPREWIVRQIGRGDPGADRLPFVVQPDGDEGSRIGTVMAAHNVEITARGLRRRTAPLEEGRERVLEEAAGWTLGTPYQRLELRTWQRPEGTAAGRDRYGLWVELEVGDARHRLRWIPPGRYLRGSPAAEVGRNEREGPQHSVTLSRGYWLGETPVTQALWDGVMDGNPSRFRGGDRPVEQVSWTNARAFCERVALRFPDLDLRLPTEAEWEYACRAGTGTPTWLGPAGDEAELAAQLGSVAWFRGNARGETQPVATLEPNPWGLYDMLGNVWEWCEDAYGEYAPGPLVDPVQRTGQFRVIRGGSWDFRARGVRAAYRFHSVPGSRTRNLGFRLAGGPAPGGGAHIEAGDRPTPEARDVPEAGR